ncbi:MAG: hypothetical protein JWO74_3327 [Solirubrobacterales bacterium]|jgi:hypothetical protein|nr:hypothetical protein [Solirubrobacterales bacterium]
MRPSPQLIARAALCVATGVSLSLFLRDVMGAFVAGDLFGEPSGGGTDRDKLRDEVTHFIEEYDGLDEEALDDLLTELIVMPYPTKEGQDS